jgi:hypothetical protein
LRPVEIGGDGQPEECGRKRVIAARSAARAVDGPMNHAMTATVSFAGQ